jgi:hypothetical protein
MWLPISGFISNETYFIRSTPYTTLTSPGNAYIPIVATAYDIANGSLFIDASRGFTRTGSISPDLAAPGVDILGPAQGNTYITMSGTSVAAAHTSGISAMLLEWGILRGNVETLDGADIKNLLLRGAIRDSGITYPSREWGYGKLNVFGVFEAMRGNP